jgi:hypothetical protein
MNILAIFVIMLYAMTGVCISIKLFKKPIGKIIMSFYFAIFWLPQALSTYVVRKLDL